jgi:hypothetical protein
MRSLLIVSLFFIALTAACSRSGLLSYTAPEGGGAGGSTGLFVETAGGMTSSIAGATSFGGATDITIGTTDSAGGAGGGWIPPAGGTTYMGDTLPTGGTSGGGTGGSSIPLVGACANLTCLNPLNDLLATCQTGATDTCTQQMTMGMTIVMNECFSNGVKMQVSMGMDMASMTMTVKSGLSVCYSMLVGGLLGNVMTIVVKNGSGTTVATVVEDTTTSINMVTCPGGTPTVVDATCGSNPGGLGGTSIPGSGANCANGICVF